MEKTRKLAKLSFGIAGMSCSSCAARIEKALAALDGVKSANVNFAVEKATVEFLPEQVGADDLIRAVRDAGYDACELSESGEKRDGEAEEWEREFKTKKTMFIPSLTVASDFCSFRVSKPLKNGHLHFLLPKM